MLGFSAQGSPDIRASRLRALAQDEQEQRRTSLDDSVAPAGRGRGLLKASMTAMVFWGIVALMVLFVLV
jgi:hypothetical protein